MTAEQRLELAETVLWQVLRKEAWDMYVVGIKDGHTPAQGRYGIVLLHDMEADRESDRALFAELNHKYP